MASSADGDEENRGCAAQGPRGSQRSFGSTIIERVLFDILRMYKQKEGDGVAISAVTRKQDAQHMRSSPAHVSETRAYIALVVIIVGVTGAGTV